MPDAKKPRKRGAPKGNKNAKGRHGGAPLENKRAVVTGEHERLLFDTLTDEEKLFMDSVMLDKTIVLREELILLTVRERRMMKRIAELTSSSTQKGMSIQHISSKEISHHRRNGLTSTTETTKDIEPVMNIVQRIEEALTRIQTRKQAIVDQIHRIEYDTERLKIEKQRVGYEGMRIDLGLAPETNPDDGVVIVNDLNSDSSAERPDNPEAT